jgi:hypothetical protein
MAGAAIPGLEKVSKGQKIYWDKSLAGFGIRLSQGGATTGDATNDKAKEVAQPMKDSRTRPG